VRPPQEKERKKLDLEEEKKTFRLVPTIEILGLEQVHMLALVLQIFLGK
jgi:hypothetical protein